MKTRKTTLIFFILLIYLLSTNISYTQTFNYNLPSGAIKRFEQGGAVYTVAFSPDGSLLASGGRESKVVVWNIGNQMKPKVFRGHTKSVMSVVFSPDGQLLASASHDGYVRLWNVSSKRTLQPLFHDGWVRSVAFSPDGKTLVSGGGDQVGSITLWDTSNNNRIVDFPGHRELVESIEFSPDGQMFVSTSRDGTVKIWDIARRRVLKSLTEHRNVKHRNVVYAVAFSPNSDTFATSSQDYTIKLWKASSGAFLEDLKKSGSGNTRALSLAFSPDGKYLAYACTDYTVRLWNINERKETKFRGHDGVVTSVAFSPDGKTLASGSQDRTIILWKLSHFNIHPSTPVDNPNPSPVQIPEPKSDNILVDTTPPNITILSPTGRIVPEDTKQILIKGEVTDENIVDTIKVNGDEVRVSAKGLFNATVQLVSGENNIQVIATDIHGNMDTQRFTITRPVLSDSVPPNIVINTPTGLIDSATKELTILGEVTDNSIIEKVTVNGQKVRISTGGKFSADVLLSFDENEVRVTATDVHQNMDTKHITFFRPRPPIDTIGPEIQILKPVARVMRGIIPENSESLDYITIDQETVTVYGTVTDPSGVLEVRINSKRIVFSGQRFEETVPINYGDNTITITAIDRVKNQSVEELQIFRPRRGNAYALLLAVEDYYYWPDLRNPVFDARSIQESLRDLYGFQTRLVENPTQADIVQELREYATKDYSDEDHLLIFFAGHGHLDKTFDLGYLVTQDTKEPQDDKALTSYLPHSEIRDIIDNIDCKHIFVVLDTCYSGTFNREIVLSNDESASPTLSESDINRILNLTTRWYLTSGSELVDDGQPGKHSPFTRKLLEALKSKGGVDGILTIEEILSHFKNLVELEPRASVFSSNENGSNFLFFAK